MIANDRVRPEPPDVPGPADVNPLVGRLAHAPLPDFADALRSAVDDIGRDWDVAVRRDMPHMWRPSVDELKDSAAQILPAIAGALASDDRVTIQDSVSDAPQRGLSRLRPNFDVVDVMQEDRPLRSMIILHVEAALGRRIESPEAAARRANVGLMLQRSLIAFVDAQERPHRAAAETEPRFASFPAHDVNDDLNNPNRSLSDLAQPDGAGATLAPLRSADPRD